MGGGGHEGNKIKEEIGDRKGSEGMVGGGDETNQRKEEGNAVLRS